MKENLPGKKRKGSKRQIRLRLYRIIHTSAQESGHHVITSGVAKS